MHLRIPAVLFCAVLLGFAAGTQSADKSYYGDQIDIDDDLEGSGGGTEVTHDLESSGSGFGPDDEDSSDVPTVVSKVEPTIQPRQNTDLEKKKEGDGGAGVTLDDPEIIMNPKAEDRPTFFAQPGILAAVTGGVVVGLVCAILVVMFIVYRMRKKDEGSYALDEPKNRSPTSNSYNRGGNKEFYA